jgi:hypothetical protein
LFAIVTLCHSQANTNLSILVSPRAVNVTLLPGLSNARDLRSSVLGRKNLYLTGDFYLDSIKYIFDTGNASAFTGELSGNAMTTGSQNVGLGYGTLYLSASGNANTASGYQTLYNTTTGSQNTTTGIFALLMSAFKSKNQ